MLRETSRGDGMQVRSKCWSSPACLLNFQIIGYCEDVIFTVDNLRKFGIPAIKLRAQLPDSFQPDIVCVGSPIILAGSCEGIYYDYIYIYFIFCEEEFFLICLNFCEMAIHIKRRQRQSGDPTDSTRR